MATNLLWFVMAGFLLGFATSTLWEWFYFRKERLKLTDRRIRELEAKIREAETGMDSSTSSDDLPDIPIPTVASVTGASTGAMPRTSAWGDASYRSPGVFLESEALEAAADSPVAGRERLRSPFTEASSLTSSPAPTSSTLAASASVPPSGVPTVDSIVPKQPAPVAASSAEAGSPAKPDSRADFQGPADALRAKRDTAARTRQELLATLRRNSEAVQRGQFPLPENANTRSEQPLASPPTRSTSLVSPEPPTEQDSPAQSASIAIEQPPKSVARPMAPERLRWINNPDLTERTKQYPDDLSKIKGIGDVYKQRLYRAGIYTWKQIAETDTEILRRAVSANQSSNIGEWHDQAVKLMEKHGRMDAVYEGPQPDDMTKILGIGPVSASVLYRSGICTYEQLASTPVADLEALFPIAVAGDQPDFAQWVARATELADQKHRDR